MASTYLSKTNPSSASTSLYKGTVSWWQKGTGGYVFGAETGSERMLVNFASTFNMYLRGSSGSPDIDYSLSGTPQFRDPSAWRHCVLAWDTTLGTAGDRIKLYVNNEEFTVTGTATTPQNHEMPINKANMPLVWGAYSTSAGYFDGSMTHCHFVDGQQLTPSTFGESDSVSSIWKPKTSPSVTYGNYGFLLKFENSGAMGTDSSGNSNTFTVSGTITQTEDTPSNNFATLNAINNYYPEATFSNGNLKITTKESAPVMSTLGVSSGKWYWEVKVNSLAGNYANLGIVGTQATASTQYISANANEYMYYSQGGLYYNGGSISSGYASYTANDIIGVAMDLDNNRLFFSKNGTWQNSADPTTSTGAYTITAPASTSLGAYFPAISYWDDNDAANGTYEANFGNGRFGTTALASSNSDGDGLGLFEYSVPSGYYALCTKNIKNYG